jgi:hypothetical protein
VAEIQSALRLIPGKTELMVIDRAGHDLGFSKAARGAASDLPFRIATAFRGFIAGLPLSSPARAGRS